MRNTFFNVIENFYKRDESVYVLTGDLGYKLFDKIKEHCSDRFKDIGIAEANMAGIAAGLALSGNNVYCYSIIPFLMMRAYEQIRVDIDYHDLNVKLVGVGGGFTYGLEGITHFGLEDFALMTSLQNMTVVVPADPYEAGCLAKKSYDHQGPMYIRLGRANEPLIERKNDEFEIGKAIILNEGKDISVFAVGSMVYTGTQVVEKLAKRGIKVTLVNMHTLKPLDKETVLEIASTHNTIISIEEHNIHGGLGSSMAEVLLENGYKGRFKRIGIPEKLGSTIGDAAYLRDIYGMTPEKICEAILKKM